MLQSALALTVLVGAAGTALARPGHEPSVIAKRSREELAAYKIAKPVFEWHCFRCHTTAGETTKQEALEHLSMDQYPFGGQHAGDAAAAIRKVLAAAGESKATMPLDTPGAVVDDDLSRILAWAEAFDRSHAVTPRHVPTKKRASHAH
jgi:cytochrome c